MQARAKSLRDRTAVQSIVRGRRSIRAQCRGVVAAATILSGNIASTTSGVAQSAEPKVQESWAYTRQIGQDNKIEYLATTPSLEDANVWLVLACDQQERFSISFVHTKNFPYSLRRHLHVMWRLDRSELISLPGAPVDQRQLALDPKSTSELILLFVHSDRLSASVPDSKGGMHDYSFSLQPHDLAFHDLDAHCFRLGL